MTAHRSPDRGGHESDPLERLRAANPVPGSSNSAPAPDAVFEDIIMTSNSPFGPPPVRTAPSAPPTSPRRGRRFAIAGVAAAAVAAVGVTAPGWFGDDLSPAHAALVAAANSTAAMESGTAIVELSGFDDHRLMLESGFHGEDLSIVVATDGHGLGHRVTEFSRDLELRVVDRVVYLQLGEDQWISVDDARIAPLLSGTPLAVDVRSNLARSVTDLVRNAQDVEEPAPNHFVATVTVEELTSLLPLSEQFLAGSSGLSDAEATLAVRVELTLDAEGMIDVMTLSHDLSTSRGAAPSMPSREDATNNPATNHSAPDDHIVVITIDFNDLGQGAPIPVPENATPFSASSLRGD